MQLLYLYWGTDRYHPIVALGNEPKLEELRQRIRGGTTGDVETGDATTGTAK